ncbi:MAG: hypothetical protein E7656_10695 [Ruminococcaceae bacterium]|nr:hypothetical protein [Oscillospiraceae bacterium]
MTFLIVAGCILGFFALIFLLLFLLVARVRFRFDTDTGVFGLSLKVLFVNLDILPTNEEKKRKKMLKKAKKYKKNMEKDGHLFPKKQKKQKSAKKIEKNAADASDQKKTLSEKIAAFGELFANICEKIRILVPGVFGALSLQIKKLDIVVGGKDAAQTAISYGAVCGAIDGLYAIGERTKKFVISDQVYVACDYLEEKFRCEFDVVLKVRLIKIIFAALKAFL